VEASLFKILIENNVFLKKRPQMIQLPPFKEKEGGEGRCPLSGQWKEKEKLLTLGGQWKEKEKLPALGGQWKEKEKLPTLGGQWKEKEKLHMLGGQWKAKEKLSTLGGQWKEKEKLLFTSFHFPSTKLPKPSSFPLILNFYFTMVLGRYLCILPFSFTYKLRLRILMSQVPHIFIVNSIWLKISSLFLETMASCMTPSYWPQAAQMNEESTSESSLDLTLTQHPCDEDPESRKVRACFEVDPLRAWYYRVFLNSRTLVILLQIDLASDDEPEIVCEGCYETEDISIFAWSSIPSVGHYH
jgi:hypothetical protein